MVREAIEALRGKTTNVAVRDWILGKYPGTNKSTIQCHIIICTVNHPSRIHYPENRKPRSADGPYDFLFRTERGKLELYDPKRHGTWQIVIAENGRAAVIGPGEEYSAATDPSGPSPADSTSTPTGECFAAENHLRDFLATHLDVIEPGLELYADDDGSVGVEYITPVGRIDILAVDANGDFLVIELKVDRGPDYVVGQVLRYKGWVKLHLANGKRVRGLIIAKTISDRIKYGLIDSEDVLLKEYDLQVSLRDVPPLSK